MVILNKYEVVCILIATGYNELMATYNEILAK